MKTKTSTRIPWYKIDIFLLCYNFIQMVLGNVKKSTSISFVPYFNTLRDLNLNNLFLSLASNNKLLWIFVKYVRYDEYLQLSNIYYLFKFYKDTKFQMDVSLFAVFV